MVKKGQNIVPLDESEYTSNEVCGFSSDDSFTDDLNENISNEDIQSRTQVAVFSFNSNDEHKEHSTDIEITDNSNNFSKNQPNSKEAMNPSTSPVQKIRGLTPKISGEAFDIKRCYQFRASTIKKLNQLKGESDNINIYLNEILDAAICYYHDAVFNNK